MLPDQATTMASRYWKVKVADSDPRTVGQQTSSILKHAEVEAGHCCQGHVQLHLKTPKDRAWVLEELVESCLNTDKAEAVEIDQSFFELCREADASLLELYSSTGKPIPAFLKYLQKTPVV